MASESGLVRRALGAVGLLNGLRTVARDQRQLRMRLRRRIAGTDRRLVASYLRDCQEARLHVGCGSHVLAGWLNCDAEPADDGIGYLDATRPFPLPAGAFGRVFSEHMIEHVPFAGGVAMLRECRRVLRTGGRIRIATPDLAFLLDLARGGLSDLQRQYVEWSTREFIAGAPYADPAFVLNNFMRDWGHAFIHDERSLRHALGEAGFVDVIRCPLLDSPDPTLRGLENAARMPPGFLALESLVLEGVAGAPRP